MRQIADGIQSANAALCPIKIDTRTDDMVGPGIHRDLCLALVVSTGRAGATVDFRDCLHGKAVNMDEQSPQNVYMKGEP